jgi:hypothetical protein
VMVSESVVDAGEVDGSEVLARVYRHDVHKLRGRRHAAASDEFAGVAVNDGVPFGADRDAALLSRPRGTPEQSVDNHAVPQRLSLVSGGRAVDDPRLVADGASDFEELVVASDSRVLHARWLTTRVAGAVNESVYYPYTSLQFHVLLAGALVDNYRAGHEFGELYLVATEPGEYERDPAAARASAVVDEYRTVLWSAALALHVTGDPDGRPGVRLGERPTRSFGDVWARLPENPLAVGGGRRWRVLDAQLRRIRSWSTAMAYITDFTAAHTGSDVAGGRRGCGGGGG